MKIEKHNQHTSTIFFENNQEFEEYRNGLKDKGFTKFKP